MFRALLFPANENIIMQAPIAITLLSGKEAPDVPLSIHSDAIFTTAVGHSSKRTLARWHVTSPQEIVEHMLDLVKDVTVSTTTTASSIATVVNGEDKWKQRKIIFRERFFSFFTCSSCFYLDAAAQFYFILPQLFSFFFLVAQSYWLNSAFLPFFSRRFTISWHNFKGVWIFSFFVYTNRLVLFSVMIWY